MSTSTPSTVVHCTSMTSHQMYASRRLQHTVHESWSVVTDMAREPCIALRCRLVLNDVKQAWQWHERHTFRMGIRAFRMCSIFVTACSRRSCIMRACRSMFTCGFCSGAYPAAYEQWVTQGNHHETPRYGLPHGDTPRLVRGIHCHALSVCMAIAIAG